MMAFLVYWYFFSKYYILGSLLVTHLLNVSFKRLWLSPLLVNAVSVVLLLVGVQVGFVKTETLFDAIYRIYVPVVLFSFLMNVWIYFYRKMKVRYLGIEEEKEGE